MGGKESHGEFHNAGFMGLQRSLARCITSLPPFALCHLMRVWALARLYQIAYKGTRL